MGETLPAILLPWLTAVALAEEGMRTIDEFPADTVAGSYELDIDAQWLRPPRLATARLENGCTGSFASADGPVLTNSHCEWSCVRNLSTDQRNLSDEGFHARRRSQQQVCPEERISVLMDTQEVTAGVARTTHGIPPAQGKKTRNAVRRRLMEEGVVPGVEPVPVYSLPETGSPDTEERGR